MKTGKKVIPLPEWGFCPVHVVFDEAEVSKLKSESPDAVLMAHPECYEGVIRAADYVGSTSQMCKYARSCGARKFIVATEVGLLHRLRKENPDKEFVPACPEAICVNMKGNTLEKVLAALRGDGWLVSVPEPVAGKAKAALQRMFEIMGRAVSS